MEIYMTENKLKPYIVGTEIRMETNAAKWDEKDAEAQAFLMRGLELDQLKYLSDCTTAAQMWSRLRTVHSEKSDQSVQVLLDRFINIKMNEDERMADFVARIMSLAQRLKDMDLKQKEQMIIAKIVGSLPSKFDNVRTAWYAVPKAEQTVDKLKDHLVNEEALLTSRSKEENRYEAAYTVRGKQHRFNHHYQKGEKSTSHNNYSQNTRSSFKRPGKCNYCNLQGHWARECRKKARDQQISRNNQSLVAQVETTKEYFKKKELRADN